MNSKEEKKKKMSIHPSETAKNYIAKSIVQDPESGWEDLKVLIIKCIPISIIDLMGLLTALQQLCKKTQIVQELQAEEKTREAIYSYNKVEKDLFDVHNVVENRSDEVLKW